MTWGLNALVFFIGMVAGYITCGLLSVNKIVESYEKRTQIKGTWEISSDGYYPYCSECGYEPPYVRGEDMRTPYCAKCGAKMEKECERK